VALFVAWHFAGALEPYLGGLLAKPPVSTWAARTLIFVLVMLLGMGIAWLLQYFVRLSLFSGTDRLLGFAFGLVRGIVLLGVFVILGQLLRLDDERWWQKSKLMPYGEGVANGLRAVVGEQLEKHGASLSASSRLVAAKRCSEGACRCAESLESSEPGPSTNGSMMPSRCSSIAGKTLQASPRRTKASCACAKAAASCVMCSNRITCSSCGATWASATFAIRRRAATASPKRNRST
jgi:membrane protein required for colicin V production